MSPIGPQHIQTASLTHVGRVRTANQDTCGEFRNDSGYRLLVVADGMGGHSGGETASRLALEAIGQVFDAGFDDPVSMLQEAFRVANQKIHRIGSSDPELHGMGTTGVAVLIGPGDEAWVAHIGDSRAYQMRSGRLHRVTEDHSWVSEEVRHQRITPDEARHHPMKNVLLRSIGVGPEVEVPVKSLEVGPGDRFLLCSDGLWGEVEDQPIAAIVGSEQPRRAVERLVDLAIENGGSDNVTVQVALVDGPDDDPTLEADVETSTEPVALAGGAAPADDATLPTPHPKTGRTHWSGPAAAFAIGLAIAALFWRACA